MFYFYPFSNIFTKIRAITKFLGLSLAPLLANPGYIIPSLSAWIEKQLKEKIQIMLEEIIRRD